MFCCSFAGGFSVHAFLKSTFTGFGGAGAGGWSGLPAAGEPTALHKQLF
jgi:hypothetical protein